MGEAKLNLDILKDDVFLDAKQVADILHVHPRTVLRMIAEQHVLPAIRVGGRWRVRQRDLAEYIRTNSQNRDVSPEINIPNVDSSSTANEAHGMAFPDSEAASIKEAMLNDRAEEFGSHGRTISQKPPFDELLLAMPAYFVGRDADLKWLLERLTSGGVTGIAALRGLGGIGKTALAAKAVRQLRKEGHFCDGIAVVFCQDLRDETRVLQSVLARFDPQRRPPEITDLADLSESAYQLLKEKDVLVVLDNIEPDLAIEKVVAPLYAAGVALLLTARQVLPPTAIPTEASRTLDLLSSEEALDLFSHSLGLGSTANLSVTERAAAERIVEALDRHTLAVKLAGAYAAHLRRDLEVLARELGNHPQRALELAGGEVPQAMMRAFAQSTEALPPEARRLFVALAAFATGDFSRNAALALAQGLHMPMPEASMNLLVLRALVDASVNRSMPEWSDRERLHLHSLLRALAASEFAHWGEEEHDATYYVIMRYYADYVCKSLNVSLKQEETNVALDQDEANITYALQWAFDRRHDELIVAICSGMQYFWDERGNTAASLRYLPWAIQAAQIMLEKMGKSTDPLRVADLLLNYGKVLRYNAQLEEANNYYRQRLAIAHEMQDKQSEGVTLYYLGRLARQLGNLEEAESYYKKALALHREVQNRWGEGWTLAFLGQIQQDRGNLEEAESYYKKALALHREVQYRRGEGWILGYLGRLALDREQYEEAEDYYQQHLEFAREMQDQRSEGVCLSFLGQIALRNKQYEKAESFLQAALSLLHGVDLQSEGWALNFLGEVAVNRGQLEDAQHFLEKALTILQKVRDLRGESKVLTQLALIAEIQDNLDHAEKLYRLSLAIGSKSQDGRIIADVLLDLGRFLIVRLGNRDAGCQTLMDAIQYCVEMKLPREKEARAVARRFECAG